MVKFRNLTYLQQLNLEMERMDRQRQVRGGGRSGGDSVQADAERNMRQVVEKMRFEQNNSPP